MTALLAQILFFAALIGILLFLKKHGRSIVDFYYNRIKWHTPITRLEQNKLKEYPSIRRRTKSDIYSNTSHPNHVDYQFIDGIFGYLAVLDSKVRE